MRLLGPGARRASDGTRRPGEGERTPTLRAQLVGDARAPSGDDPEVRAEAHRRYDAAQRGATALDPDLASAVLDIVAARAGPSDYEAFLARYRHPATPQEEIRYLYALAGFADPTLAARTFELALHRGADPERPVRHPAAAGQPRHRAGDVGARRASTGTSSWPAFPANILPRMLDGVTLAVPRPAARRRGHRVRRAHPLPIGQRTVDQTLERSAINVAFVSRVARRPRAARAGPHAWRRAERAVLTRPRSGPAPAAWTDR